MRIKIRKADTLFSKWIRARDGWRCQVCGKQYEEGDQRLQCSHFFGRRKESVRFHPLNADAKCFACHQRMGSNPAEFYQWKLARIGQKAMNELTLLSNTPQKKDDKLVEMYYTKLLLEISQR